MNARQRGPTPPAALALLDARPGHFRLAVALTHTVPELVLRGIIDPYSATILAQLPQHVYAPAALLAWSKCRWNELAAVDMEAVVAGRRWRIFPSKGSQERWIRPYMGTVERYWRNVPITVPVSIVGYSSLCAALAAAQDAAGITVPDQHHSKTHIFRHFYASWRNARGALIEDIAHELGHYSTDSTRRYIHEVSDLIVQPTR